MRTPEKCVKRKPTGILTAYNFENMEITSKTTRIDVTMTRDYNRGWKNERWVAFVQGKITKSKAIDRVCYALSGKADNRLVIDAKVTLSEATIHDATKPQEIRILKL